MIDESKEEVQKMGLDPYDDFKDITENVESELIKTILDHEEFLETVTIKIINAAVRKSYLGWRSLTILVL